MAGPELRHFRVTAGGQQPGEVLVAPGVGAEFHADAGGAKLARASDDQVLACLTLALGSRPEAVTEHSFCDDGGYDFRLTGYKLTAPVSLAQRAQARALVDAACASIDRAELAQELTKLRLVTVSSLRGADLEGWIMVMMEELEAFPAAIVIEACRRWRRRQKFAPTCAELVEECHQCNRSRRALRRLVEVDVGG